MYVERKSLMWHADKGREKIHIEQRAFLFVYSQPKMGSFFPLLSASSLRQERMERVLRADTMSQSEARTSTREREGR